MTNADEILNVLKYFAKFPHRDGVLKNFIKTEEIFPGYTELKSEIQAMPEALMPSLTDYIFTDDEKELGKFVRNIKSYFMLIEYGPITIDEPNENYNRIGDWHLAVNIAHPTDGRNYDPIEKMMLRNECLNKVIKLAQFIAAEDTEACSGCDFLKSQVVISPIEPYLFHQCTGWSLTFKKQFNDVF